MQRVVRGVFSFGLSALAAGVFAQFPGEGKEALPSGSSKIFNVLLQRDGFSDSKLAWAMMPPELVSDGTNSSIAWSSGGRYLAWTEVRLSPAEADKSGDIKPSYHIQIWDRSTGRVKKLANMEFRPTSLRWAGDRLLARVDVEAKEPQGRLVQWWLLDPARIGKKLVTSFDAKEVHLLYAMPSGDVYLLPYVDQAQADGYNLNAQGQFVSAPGSLMESTNAVLKMIEQMEAKKTPHVTTRDISFGAGLTAKCALIHAPGYQRARDLGSRAGGNPDDYISAVVAGQVEEALMSPDGGTVAYTSQGRVFVRRIRSVPFSDYRDALVEAEKQKMMAEARAVAMAMIIYAADYDDVLPGGDWREALKPYMKDWSMLDRFVMNVPGASLNNVGDVSKEVMGYISGEFGRVNVYYDTHMEWVGDKK